MKRYFKNHPILIGFLVLLMFTQCRHDHAGVRDVSVAGAEKMIRENAQNPAFILLDVRTPGEFSSGHLAGAINIDYSANDFEKNLEPLDKGKTYLVYCRTGNRSSGAAEIMGNRGFTSLENLDGGIMAWAAAHLPVVL